jgi:hypothetical protein
MNDKVVFDNEMCLEILFHDSGTVVKYCSEIK